MIETLALSGQATPTADLLARAAVARGMSVAVLAGPRPDLCGSTAYYGGPRFADTVAASLDVALLEPAANMAWFSNIYAADATRCLDTILTAAGPRTALPATDRRFVRPTHTWFGSG
ncbi:hypothetical protein [Embleya scabrispora]|uniref:hypothetical protein n=1 Tax=Embleya scabrispora TaxID=159449 RepID=UPI00037737E8|nr:hypothetical protein [Embleya scabrispora]